MANTSIRKGFHVMDYDNYKSRKRYTEASFAGEPNDDLYMDTAGRATTTGSGVGLGFQDGLPYDASTGIAKDTPGGTTADADDIVNVYDNPLYEAWAEITTGALTSPYTTRSSAAAYDGAGSQGDRYVDAAASTNDSFRIVDRYHESDGSLSLYSTNQKVVVRWNLLKHVFGVIA